MALLNKLLGAGIVGFLGYGINNIIKNNKEEKRRINIPCRFSDNLSQSEFVSLVDSFAKKIKRLTVSVSGHIINGTVRSQSGLSEWTFKLDFNDYGKVTGEYWIYSENSDSLIPSSLGDKIKKEIKTL